MGDASTQPYWLDGAGGEREIVLVQMVRDSVGAIANFKRALIVARLPKTRSGKILRQVMRKMVDKQEYTVPSTIEDDGIIPELAQQLEAEGIL